MNRMLYIHLQFSWQIYLFIKSDGDTGLCLLNPRSGLEAATDQS